MGITATLKLRNQKFALVLLDISMPKKTGFDLIAEFVPGSLNIKENILIVSGTLEKDLIAKIIQNKVTNFMVKPFDETHFQEKVLKILSTQKV